MKSNKTNSYHGKISSSPAMFVPAVYTNVSGKSRDGKSKGIKSGAAKPKKK